MSEAVRRLVSEAADVRKLARKMIVMGGTDGEFADIRLAKLTDAIAAVEAELPAMTVMSKDEFMKRVDDLANGPDGLINGRG